MTAFYTYLHCKPDGTIFYVGKGCRRRSHELNRYRSKYHMRIVAKYGIRIFVFPCDSEAQAFADEVQQIRQLRQEGYALANHTDGGQGLSGRKHSLKSRAKIAASMRGKIPSPETVAKRNATRAVTMRAKLEQRIQK